MIGFYNLDEIYLCLEICKFTPTIPSSLLIINRKGQVASLKIQPQEGKMKAL